MGSWAGASPLVSWSHTDNVCCSAALALWPVSTCWWAGPGTRVFWAWCLPTGWGSVPELVLGHWCEDLGHGFSDCRVLNMSELVSVHMLVGPVPKVSQFWCQSPVRGLGLEVGRARSQSDWRLSWPYGRQPAGGWGCVPAQIAAWLVTSQDWYWLSGRWSWVLALISLREGSKTVLGSSSDLVVG